MDYSSADSEIIESLDILRPRVKRFEHITENTTSTKHRGNIFNVYKNKTDYITENSATAHCVRTAASSTSLILKKTSQREILKKYSILSYTSLLRCNRNPNNRQSTTTADKPLIKVTVIPKTPQAQTINSHRRRKTTRKVKNSVSNHENSIHTKNLYLIVAGRKKEKVYEIKTTGSAKFSSDAFDYRYHHEDNLRNRSNIKEVIKSLNMDKKKKKAKNKKDAKQMSLDFPEGVESHHDCRCMASVRDDGRCVESSKSRVRIFGQVDLTEDKRYIVKCDATVDGEPIMTKFESERTRTPQYVQQYIADTSEPTRYHTNYNAMACYGGYCGNDTYRDLRDSNIQVDFGCYQNANESIHRSTENQGTQVNFSMCPSKTTLRTKNNQTIQCNYANIPKIINISANESKHKLVQGCQSPLVIISVYPKQEATNDAKNVNQNVVTNTRPSSPRNSTYISKDIKSKRNDCCRAFLDRNDESPKPSRSTSPNRHNVHIQKRRDINRTEKVFRSRTNSPNRSPNRSKAPQNNERKKTSPNRLDDSDKYTCSNMRKINQMLTSRGVKKTNTEIKKAIVDDYTRRITESMNRYAELSPKHETSKVKINIDSENEYYDVQFEQGQRITDLKIRKTLKEASPQKHDGASTSPNNVFLYPEKETNEKQFAQYKHERNDDNYIRNSNINVKDSIEICHRRVCGPSKKDVQTHKSPKQNAYMRDTDFLAPIKHYKGDDCELPNPVERDKQIRQLLGINKVKNNTNKQNHMFGDVVGDHGLFDYFYKTNSEKNIETGLSLCNFGSKITPTSHKIKTKMTQKESPLERTSLYQQLVLNKNIQVFLQIEHFTEHKPIVLSRKQYDKVKRTIQKSISKKTSQDKGKKPVYKTSLISVGEVRKRNKQENLIRHDCNKYTQTNFIIRHTQTDLCNEINKLLFVDNKRDVSTTQAEEPRLSDDENIRCDDITPEMKTVVLFDSKKAKYSKKIRKPEIYPMELTSSSFGIHYETVGYMKQVTFSSTNFGTLSTSSIIRRNDSLYTIFKGRKRSVTPNLGTSDITLSPREVRSGSAKDFLNDSKPRKPFLRRLMSCLVMRSKTSDVRVPVRPTPLLTSVNSSIDSYKISTSLGAIQMSSSLYDTTASFYTSHSVLPLVNSKTKRGFFNSVRCFLTNRKS